MKQFRLLVAAIAVAFSVPVLAQTDDEYNAALENIKDGSSYVISTTFNGTEEGSTTYYLTTGGTLTTSMGNAGQFKFVRKEVSNGFKPVGWNVNNFTNPAGNASTSNNNAGKIATSGQNRDTYERQVFFLNSEGKYAVRATNAQGEDWGANTYWTVIANGNLPNAGYNLTAEGKAAGAAFVWNLTDAAELADQIAKETAKADLNSYVDKVLKVMDGDGYTYDQTAKGAVDRAISMAYSLDDEATLKDYQDAKSALEEAFKGFLQTVQVENGKSVDFTGIMNNDTPTSNADGWTLTDNPTFDPPANVAEYWNKSGASISQKVNLPAGTYKLTAIALTRNGMTATLAADTLASTNIVTVATNVVNSRAQADTWFNAGNGVNDVVFTIPENQDVNISLTADNTTGDHWLVWRSFSLHFFGSHPAGPYMESLNEAVAAAEALEGKVPAGVYARVAAVVAENNKEFSTKDSIDAAIAAINAAVAQAAALQAPYEHYKTVLAAAQADEAKSHTGGAEEQAALDATIAEQNANVDTAETADVFNAAADSVKAAHYTFIMAANPTNGNFYDVTDAYITNPTPTANADGWTVSTAPTFDATNNVAEFWNVLGASISQTLKELPASFYQLTAVALTRTASTAKLAAGIDTMAIATVGMNEVNDRGGANTWFNAGNGVNKLNFIVAEPQDVTISLTTDSQPLVEDVVDNWTVWRSFSLKKYGDSESMLAYIDSLSNQFDSLSGKVPAQIYAADSAVIDSVANASDYVAMVSTLESSLATLGKLVEPYSHYKAVRQAMVAIAAQPTLGTVTVKDAQPFSVAVQDSIADSATDSATIAKAADDVVSTLKTYISTVEITNGAFDLTYFVNNPSPVKSLEGWTVTTDGMPKSEQGRNVCEFWKTNFDFNQVVANLPEGVYAFSMKGLARQGSDNIDLYANADSVPVVRVANTVVNNQQQADPWLDVEGNGNTKVFTALGTSGSVKIGLNNAADIDLDSDEDSVDGWTVWRSFKLEYAGNDTTKIDSLRDAWKASSDLQAIKDQLTAAITTATTLAADSANAGDGVFLTPLSAYQTLAQAAANAQLIADGANDAATLQACLAALNKAIDTFNSANQAPAADHAFMVLSKADETLGFTATESGNGNAKVTAAYSAIYFEATAGGYYLKSDSNLYIGNAGTNNWTMTASTEPNTVYTIAYAGDGYYTISSNKGSIGYDDADADPALYADKNETKSGDKVLWKIADYVASGITDINADSKFTVKGNIYSIDGKLVRSNATSIEGLNKGMYIVNGRKVVVK